MTQAFDDAAPEEKELLDREEISFPLDLTPAQLIERGRELLAAFREEMIASRLETSARANCARTSRFHDELIRALHRHKLARWEADGRGAPGSHSIIALGGYGRREMFLQSDVDLLFLIGDRKTQQEVFVKELLHVLIDWRLDVGFVVRRIEDCLATIGADPDSATAMIESRCIAGSKPLFQHYHETFTRAMRGSGRKWYLQAKFAEWKTRHDKYDSSIYLLEPNLKESKGGLRDLHTVRWIMYVTQGNGELAQLEHLGILTAAELRRLRAAEEFVTRLRFELHALLPRKSDALNFESQVEIAKRLGYEPAEHALPEEVLMREYYGHARQIAKLASRSFYILIGNEKSTLGALIGSLKRKRIDAHFQMYDGVMFLDKGSEGYLRSDPMRILPMFARARKLKLKVSDRTRQNIEDHVGELGEEFQSSPSNLKYFMDILAGPENVAAILRDMHDCGVLSAYIPEFANVHFMVRMDYYHRYTVDEHLIKAVEMFERLLSDPPPHVLHAASIAREIEKRDLLNLSLLLHDVGKGMGKGHALIGGQLVQRIGPRMGLEADDVELLRFLVLSHLKFSHVTGRRDLDDPQVARQMAEEVGTLDRLKLLYVHSVCDLMAVSPQAMTEWKAQLFEACYRVTARELGGVQEEPAKPDLRFAAVASRVAEYLERHPRLGLEEGADAEPLDPERQERRLEEFLESVPERYLQTTRIEYIAEHFRMMQRLDEKTKILWQLHPGVSMSELTVCAADIPGSFANTCGALAAKEINICSAQIFSTRDGYAINCFQITDLDNNPLPEGYRLERLRTDLNSVFLDKKPMEELIEKYDKHKAVRATKRTPRPSEIRIDNEGSSECTILEIRTMDRPGLLYQIASVLDENRLNIQRAMANTEAYGVIDVFYVTDLDYNKLHDESQRNRLTARLKKVLDPPSIASDAPNSSEKVEA